MTGSYPEIEQKGLGLAQDWSPTWALGWEVGGLARLAPWREGRGVVGWGSQGGQASPCGGLNSGEPSVALLLKERKEIKLFCANRSVLNLGNYFKTFNRIRFKQNESTGLLCSLEASPRPQAQG